jgi:hypothetical protein
VEDQIALLRRLPVRLGGLGMYAVRDARSTSVVPWTPSPKNAAKALSLQLQQIREKRQEGQPNRVVVVTEADGSVPFYQEVCEEFGVPLHSGSGSVPLSLTHELAAEAVLHWRKTGVPTVVLMVTDLDEMGLKGIFVPAARDIEKFAGDYGDAQAVQVHRLGVTSEQVRCWMLSRLRQAKEHPPSWWPLDVNGDAWELPTSEAVLDNLVPLMRSALETLLPDSGQRQIMIEAEDDLRADTVDELRALLDAVDEAADEDEDGEE